MSGLRPESNSIVKTLLTSTTPLNLSSKILPSSSGINVSRPVPSLQYTMPSSFSRSRIMEDSVTVTNMHNYYNTQYSSIIEKDATVIAMEHCYAKPLHWTPESAFFQSTKMLFMPLTSAKRKSSNPLAPLQECDDVIDVETIAIPTPELYDKGKACHVMEECERHATFARVNQGNEDWEDTISKVNWTPTQIRVFNGLVNILNSDRLSRLAHSKAHHEPILRRITIDKSVKRIRHLFATISWDPRLTQWFHQLLIDNLSTPYLAAYFDILQTLKAKLPTFVDKMMYGPNSTSRVGVTSNESLFHLLKRPWDPFASNISQNRPRKLPGTPVIVIVPSAPVTSNASHSKRQHKWINLLSTLTTVVVVHSNIGNSASRITMINCADQMLATTRTKIQEVKQDYPGKSIILVGFNAGAALALQVAQVEHVACVVCLGFSVLTAEGRRGDPDDSLLELQCPVLFVIGQCSNTSLQEDVEDLRERMRVENGLIVVGSADDYLRVNKKKKRTEGITQSAVDRFIMENVAEFISNLLLSPYPPQMRQSPTHITSLEAPAIKRAKVERKRHNSNGSSIDSEPPSPTPKISRPGIQMRTDKMDTRYMMMNRKISEVGRPPGSKSKSKLDAKWAAQMAQGIPHSSPENSSPPILIPVTNETTPTLLPPPSLASQITSEISNEKALSKIPASLDVLKNPIDKKPSTISNIVSKTNTSPVKTASSAAKVMGFNRSVLTSGSALSNLLQSGCRPIVSFPQGSKIPSGIKVLENLSLNTNSTAKLVSSTTGRSVDLSKITVLNSVGNSKTTAPIVFMPDGKLKSAGSTVKGTGSTPILLPMSTKTKVSHAAQTSTTAANRIAKYITSKKQLIGKKPPQKPSIVPSYSANLLPPTNLTSQDIMDLPIIFADDNQMLTDNANLQQSDVPVPEIVQPAQQPKSNPVGKFVFINKQIPLQTSLVGTSSNSALKKTTLSVPVRTSTNPLKYTKIIISRGSTSDTKISSVNALTKISSLSPEISIRKIEPSSSTSPSDGGDLENKLVATTIPKPDYVISNMKSLIAKKEQDLKSKVDTSEKLRSTTSISSKRTVAEANIDDRSKNENIDVTPAKTVKLIGGI